MRYLFTVVDLSWLHTVYFHQTVSDYLLFAGIIIITLVLKKPVAGLLTRLSSRIAAHYTYMEHREALRDMLFRPIELLLQVICYFIAADRLSNILNGIIFHRSLITRGNFNISLGDITDHIFLFLFIFFLTQSVTRLIDFIYYLRMGKAREENNSSRLQMLPLIKEMGKLLTWTLGVFWVLGSVCHVNVPALITGLGIGGVAIALAGKETVENFFAAFTILSDKPFQAGDTIKIGDTEGVVERIGFRSTRLRNTDGAEYIIPNQHMVSQNLINLSKRSTRGIKVTANIKYGMSDDALREMMDELRQRIQKEVAISNVTITLDHFEKETFQLVTSFQLPHPLPEGSTLTELEHKVKLLVFSLIGRYSVVPAVPVNTLNTGAPQV
ncbi:MAG: mechanosensitive ion channel family protein [Taibaiella sp.]|nr:mechanosensitive ion channel family protein [Taibaiella sp.]